MRLAALGDVCAIDPAPARRLGPEDLCSFVAMDAVDEVEARITVRATRRVADVDTGYTPFEEGDVLLAKIGSSMENGKCAIAQQLVNGVGFGSTEFYVLRPGSDVTAEWLLYFWRNPATRKRAEEQMTGSAQRRVPLSFLQAAQLPLPSIADQRRQIALLRRAESLSRVRRYALGLADDLQHSLFLDAFAESDCSPEVATVEELAAEKPNAIRTGPFGSQLLHSEFTHRGIAVLGIDNVVSNRFEWAQRRFITPEKYAQLRRYRVAPGDVLISIMGTCGRCAVVPSDIPTAINTKHLCCITLNQDRCLPQYLHMAFLHHPSVRHALDRATQGAIMDGLNMQIVKGLPIPLPPIDAQRRFVSASAQLGRVVEQLGEALRLSNHVFGSLLARSFRSDDRAA